VVLEGLLLILSGFFNWPIFLYSNVTPD